MRFLHRDVERVILRQEVKWAGLGVAISGCLGGASLVEEVVARK